MSRPGPRDCNRRLGRHGGDGQHRSLVRACRTRPRIRRVVSHRRSLRCFGCDCRASVICWAEPGRFAIARSPQVVVSASTADAFCIAASRCTARLSHTGDYAKSLVEDPIESFAYFEESIELSRRFRALKLWLSFAIMGWRSFARRSETTCDTPSCWPIWLPRSPSWS